MIWQVHKRVDKAIAGLAIVVALSTSQSCSAEEAMKFSTENPMLHCIELSKEALADLGEWPHRLLLEFVSYTPPKDGHPGFRVSSKMGAANQYEVLGEFAIHPMQAFASNNNTAVHKFQFLLTPHLKWITQGRYCLKLEFKQSNSNVGTAQVTIAVGSFP